MCVCVRAYMYMRMGFSVYANTIQYKFVRLEATRNKKVERKEIKKHSFLFATIVVFVVV